MLRSVMHHRVLVMVTLWCLYEDQHSTTGLPAHFPPTKKKVTGAQLPGRHQEKGTLSFANGEVTSGTFSHISGLKSFNAEQVTIISNQDQKRFQSATYPVKCWLRDLRSKYYLSLPWPRPKYFSTDDSKAMDQTARKEMWCCSLGSCAGIRETKLMPLATKATFTLDIHSFPRTSKNGFIYCRGRNFDVNIPLLHIHFFRVLRNPNSSFTLSR